jgi:hypothetical protein
LELISDSFDIIGSKNCAFSFEWRSQSSASDQQFEVNPGFYKKITHFLIKYELSDRKNAGESGRIKHVWSP